MSVLLVETLKNGYPSGLTLTFSVLDRASFSRELLECLRSVFAFRVYVNALRRGDRSCTGGYHAVNIECRPFPFLPESDVALELRPVKSPRRSFPPVHSSAVEGALPRPAVDPLSVNISGSRELSREGDVRRVG